jgi:hypothetical protein
MVMTGRQAPIYAQCQSLLSDEALDRLMAHPEGDIIACILYGMLTEANFSLRRAVPIERGGTTHWVPRMNGALCGWGLAIGETPLTKWKPPGLWAVGRWADDTLTEGFTRAVNAVDAVHGDDWHWRGSPTTLACEDATRHAQWVGRIVGGVADGRGVWQVLDRRQCRHLGMPCDVRCAGTWSRGALVRGNLKWADGHIYTGHFKDNLFDGFGALDMGRGARYVGQWTKGRPDGEGTLYNNGSHHNEADPVPSLYSGQWRQGRQQGRGTKEWADGRRYDGQWSNGRANGQGSFVYSHGSRYDGNWRWGDRHGQGALFGPDGRLERQGYWAANRPCSRIAFCHHNSTGQQAPTTRCVFGAIRRPFSSLIDWVYRPPSVGL